MAARGFNIAQEGHVLCLVPPQNISGGVNGVFSMANAAKANIIINWGALSAAPGTVQLFACTDIGGDNAVAIPFDRYQQTSAGAGNDVLAARVGVPSTGYTPSDVPNTIDVLELQADVLAESGSTYVKVVIADGSNTDFVCVDVVLTGYRFQGESNQSATV